MHLPAGEEGHFGVSAPLTDVKTQEFIGVITVRFFLPKVNLLRFPSALGMEAEWLDNLNAVVLQEDGSGVIVSGPPALLGRRAYIPLTLPRNLSAEQAQRIFFSDREGKRWVGEIFAIPEPKGLLLVSLPERVVFRPLQRLNILALVLLLLSFSASLFYTFVLHRWIVEPIRSISGIMREIAGGDWNRRAPAPQIAEISLLTDSFNSLLGSLQRSFLDLQVSEQRYRSLFEKNPAGVFHSTIAGEFIDCNQAFALIFGYSIDEIRKMKAEDLYFNPSFRREYLMKLHEEKQLKDVEIVGKRKDGQPVHLLESSYLEEDEQGIPRIIHGVCLDITHRIASEEKIRMLSTAVAQTADAVFVTDPQGVFQYVNPAFEELTGYKAEEVSGQTPRILKSAKMPPEYYQNLWNTILAGNVFRAWEVINRRKDGTFFCVDETITPLRDQKGATIGFVSTLKDITELKQAEKALQTQLQRVSTLRNIDLAIAGSLDSKLVFEVILEQILSNLGVDAADILLFHPLLNRLECTARRGFYSPALEFSMLRIGEGFAGKSALERKIIHIPDLREEPGEFRLSPHFLGEGFVTYFALPLIARGELLGVLEIFSRKYHRAEAGFLDFLETLSHQLAIAIENLRGIEEKKRAYAELLLSYDYTLEGWVRALDLRDQETEGHTQRVCEMTVRFAQHLDIPKEQMPHIRRGALLHDIGKIAIPDTILLKPGKLTDEEWVIMRKHPVYAYEFLRPIPFLHLAIDIPYRHHEKWDGSGYPGGLKRETIPLPARMFALVDVWDALLSDRPYRKAWSREQARDYIREQSGTHFDPELVDVFLKIFAPE